MAKLTSGPLEALYVGGVDVGTTIAPLTFAPSSAEYVRLRTEQQAGTIGISDVHSVAFMASTMLAEATVENIARAVGLPASAVEGGKKIIITSPTLPEEPILAYGPGPEDTEEAVADRPRSRLISMPRCISMSLGGGDPLISWSRAEQTGIPLSFELLQTPSTGEFFTVYDYQPFFTPGVVIDLGTHTTATADDGDVADLSGHLNLADAFAPAVIDGLSWDNDPGMHLVFDLSDLNAPKLKNKSGGALASGDNGIYIAKFNIVDQVKQRTDDGELKITLDI